MKNLPLKTLIAVVAFGAAIGSASAFRQELPRLPSVAFLDTEVSQDYAFNTRRRNARLFAFTLEFTGTASNNVEVAFGRDADGDGKLSFAEADVRVGWDCGRYFLERIGTGEVLEECTVGEGDERSFEWFARLDKTCRLTELSLSSEAGPAFGGVSADPPNWICGSDWDIMRLTARGADAAGESFEVEAEYDCFRVILR